MLQSGDQLTTPTTGESRRRKRESTPSSDTSSTNLPPPCKLTVRMSTEFADSLLAALEDERIARRLSEIITASLHQKLDRQAEEIAELKQKGAAMEERQAVQDSIIDDQEQYSRRECVRIWCTTAETKEEDTDKLVLRIAEKMSVNLDVEEVSRPHRVGRPGGNKPRAIICRFVNWRVKQRLMKGRRELRDTDIHVSDDLTRRRSNLFFLASQKKKLKRCAQTWTYDGKIFVRVTDDSPAVVITDSDHLERVCKA